MGNFWDRLLGPVQRYWETDTPEIEHKFNLLADGRLLVTTSWSVGEAGAPKGTIRAILSKDQVGKLRTELNLLEPEHDWGLANAKLIAIQEALTSDYTPELATAKIQEVLDK